MNKLFLVTLMIVAGVSAHAYIPGSQCGLTDFRDENWKSLPGFRVLDISEELLPVLSGLEKQQLVSTAKWYFKNEFNFSDSNLIQNTKHAIRELKDRSEAGDLNISYLSIFGKRYVEVMFYPGGNPYGALFHFGSDSIIATIGDDDVNCETIYSQNEGECYQNAVQSAADYVDEGSLEEFLEINDLVYSKIEENKEYYQWSDGSGLVIIEIAKYKKQDGSFRCQVTKKDIGQDDGDEE